MALREITLQEAMTIAQKKGLRPGKVRGTTRVQFTRGKNYRIEVVDWSFFRTCLKKRGLAIYEDEGFLKLMKRR
ncbi:MAG: hypothetical protein QW379_02255 [Thermoplasmata archaeon]